MLTAYIQAALKRAVYEPLEESEGWFAGPGLGTIVILAPRTAPSARALISSRDSILQVDRVLRRAMPINLRLRHF